MINFKKIGIIFAVALSLFLTGCSTTQNPSQNTGTPAESQKMPDIEHTAVNFNDLEYARPDVAALEALITTTSELTKEDGKEQEILDNYDAILNGITEYDTMQILASLNNTFNVNDEYYSSESEFLDSYYVKLDNKMIELTGTILDSNYADAFKTKMGEDFINRYEINRKLNSPEIEELSDKEVALVTKYTKASVDSYTTTYNGVEVTIDDLDFTDPNVATPYYEIYEKKNAVLGEIYRELVQVRIQIAQKLGYNSYTQYAYEVLGYDFSPADASKMEKYVVETIAPLYQELNYKYAQDIMKADEYNTATFNEGIPTLKEAIEAEFPEYMNIALNYMLDNNMYLFTEDPNAQQAAYTTLIPKYNAPYLYMNSSVYSDPSTVFHEFGHYYNFFYYDKLFWGDGNDLNLAEVHSQGLEVLMFPYYKNLYGDYAKDMEYSQLINMLGSILQGCAEDEFQQEVFKNPDMSLDDMNLLHGEIFTKYMGYPIYYEWADIHHHFETPFYYISYATSAVAALELWEVSQTNRSEALTIYDKITQYPQNSHFIEALENVGLSSPFSSKTIDNIAKALRKEMP